VGVGHLGRFHAQKYQRISDVDLVGVSDQNMERAKEVAEEIGCRAFESVEALMDEVDAVSVAVPTDRHFEVGRKVLEKGVHCLLEKPIAGTLEEADGLIDLAGKQGLVLQVGHIERFNPALRALQDFSLMPMFIESHRLAAFNPRGTEVAVVLDLMIHDIDAILSIVSSPVRQIDASGVAVVSDSIDIANARLRFENGCVANLTASRISQKKMRKMRFFQRDAYVAVDFLERNAEIFTLSKGDGPGQLVDEIGVGERRRQVRHYRPPVPGEDGLLAEIQTFVRSVNGDTGVRGVSGDEARAALSVALKILESMEA
jgi:predicted dehydrogenase